MKGELPSARHTLRHDRKSPFYRFRAGECRIYDSSAHSVRRSSQLSDLTFHGFFVILPNDMKKGNDGEQ